MNRDEEAVITRRGAAPTPAPPWARATDSAVDATRWPDVAEVGGPWWRGRVAWALFRRAMSHLPLRVMTPDGSHFGTGGAADPVMLITRPEAFARRLGHSGLIGFGEAWMARDWEADDLVGVLTIAARELATLVPPSLQRLRGQVLPSRPTGEGTPAGARRNIAHHYDLSTDLFELFLDPTLTYSAALFPEERAGRPHVDSRDLVVAQHRKIDRLLDAVGVGVGTALLEIGSGWGELALRAGRRGAEVRSITLSEAQRDVARERVAAAGLSPRVSIDLCDYRDVRGEYDAIVSVEMIEAVGEQFWPVYFVTLDRRLRPGGRVGLQSITMRHDRMVASRHTYTWINKYIFPGGIIPSVEAIEDHVARFTRLTPVDRFAFGAHYAETLRVWRERFERATAAADALGFDATFRRMWRLYLGYSEAGFRSGHLDVNQFVFEKA